MTQSHHASSFNPNHLDEAAIVQALASGHHAEVLQAYFGEALYAPLTQLAARALQASIDSRRVVYLLPGLLGSRLLARSQQGSELLWLDPLAVVNGRLTELAIGRRRRVVPAGVMLPGYLLCKLSLQAAGFQVRTYAYDWRRSIVALGRQLADEWLHERADEIMVVGHSMGGLVARAALNYSSSAKVSRVVQLGAPNQGSWAMLQVLRGCYPTVLKLAAVDTHHDAWQLTEQVFHGFYSFYEMLPQPQSAASSWLRATRWPTRGLQPRAERLRYARRLPRYLASADQRCHAIVGTGQLTVSGVSVVNDELVFDYVLDGDGTVPIDHAHWPGAQHWYVPGRHGWLPLLPQVNHAVIELLQGATTRTLASTHSALNTVVEQRSESALRAQLSHKVRWDRLPLAVRRELLEPTIPEAFRSAPA